MSTKIWIFAAMWSSQIHRASVLLSKQEDLCSTNHYSSTSHYSSFTQRWTAWVQNPDINERNTPLSGPSLHELARLCFPSFPTHTSYPFMGKLIRKSRVTPVPRKPAHTLREGRTLPLCESLFKLLPGDKPLLYESLVEKEEYFHRTSHELIFEKRRKLPLYESKNSSSTSHSSSFTWR